MASEDQWRALVARDRGCVLCAAAPQYCEAHHIRAWGPPARGPTDIENLALVCATHHHRIHATGHRLVRAGPGRWDTAPDDEHDLAA